MCIVSIFGWINYFRYNNKDSKINDIISSITLSRRKWYLLYNGGIFNKSLITGHGGIQVLILYIPGAQNFFNIKYFFDNQDHFGPKKFGIWNFLDLQFLDLNFLDLKPFWPNSSQIRKLWYFVLVISQPFPVRFWFCVKSKIGLFNMYYRSSYLPWLPITFLAISSRILFVWNASCFLVYSIEKIWLTQFTKPNKQTRLISNELWLSLLLLLLCLM